MLGLEQNLVVEFTHECVVCATTRGEIGDTRRQMLTHKLSVLAQLTSRRSRVVVVCLVSRRLLEVGLVLDLIDERLHEHVESLLVHECSLRVVQEHVRQCVDYVDEQQVLFRVRLRRLEQFGVFKIKRNNK